MVAYLDSSLALRHMLRGEITISQALACDRTVSSELMEIECRRVIQRCRLQGELDDEGVLKATERLEKLLNGMYLLSLSSAVKKRAMEAFPVSIKTLDALHLASALALAEKSGGEKPLIFSHGTGMNRCAKVLGFQAPLAEE